MKKNSKKRQKQNQKKAQKKKLRQEKIKKQSLAKPVVTLIDIDDMVDHALEQAENGNRKEADRILEKLNKKHDNNAYVYFGFGVLAVIDDKHDEAARLFEKAVLISPDFVEAQFNLANAYQKLLNVEEMIIAYRRVVEIGPPGSVLVRRAQRLLDDLSQEIRETEGISVDDYLEGYQAFNNGFALMNSEDWAAAIKEFNRTIEINPNHPQSYGNLGICYASLGQKRESLNAFDKAIELDPSYEPALVNRTIVESLKEGERLEAQIKRIEYYRDYPMQKRSYIQEVAEEQGLWPDQAGQARSD